MNYLAEMALHRARGRMNSVQSRASKAPTKMTISTSAAPVSTEVVADSPINHFMYLEGRNWAIDLVSSLRGSPVDVVTERLAGAMVDRPGSYAAGIHSVISELQAGLGND